MMKRLAALLLMTWLTPLAVSGCEEAEVKRYRAPKDEAPPPLVSEHVTGGAATPRATGGAMRSAASAGPQRLLAAIVPRDDQVWFVKLMGPAALVDAEAPRFAQLIESLRFAGDEGGGHPTWSTPQGWRLGAESAGRFATLILPTDPPLETTISALPPHSGDLLSNVNRWRGQLGLRPTGTPALPTMTREIELNGVSATLVDLRSEGGGVAAPMPREVVAPPTDTAAAPGGKPITYTTPEGWTEQPGEGMRLAWWTIAEGEQEAICTVIPLGPAAGSELANVNRWRQQVGLGPWSAQELKDQAGQLMLDGEAALYVDLNGGEQGRILGVIAPRGGRSWFIKMTGPDALVGANKAKFESLIGSIRFADGGGS